jgi:hypothetical protein
MEIIEYVHREAERTWGQILSGKLFQRQSISEAIERGKRT